MTNASSSSPGDSFDLDYEEMVDKALEEREEEEFNPPAPEVEPDHQEFAGVFRDPEIVDASRLDMIDLFSGNTPSGSASTGASATSYDIEVLDMLGEAFNALKHQESPVRAEMFRDLAELELDGVDPEDLEDELTDLGYSDSVVENGLERYKEAGLIDDQKRLDGLGCEFYGFMDAITEKVAEYNLGEDIDELADDYGIEFDDAVSIKEDAVEAADTQDTENYIEEISKVFQKVSKMPGDGANRLKVFMHKAEQPDADYKELAEDTTYEPNSVSMALSEMKDVGLLDDNGEATEMGETLYRFSHGLHQNYDTLKNIHN